METNKRKIHQLGLRVPQNQYDRIISLAGRSGSTINSFTLQALDVGLSQIEKLYDERVNESLDFPKEKG